MTDMTPDELRKACHLDDDDGVTVTRCWGVMRAAADAWEKARRENVRLDQALSDLHDSWDTLRTRLEAAKRELAWYRENTGGPCMGCGYYAKYPVCTKCGRPFPALTALAGEEKP